FWIYHQVGCAIYRKTGSVNPYKMWIEGYIDPQYAQTVEKMIDLTEKSAAVASPSDQKNMQAVFIYSTQLELQFWEAAYRLEKWPFLR
ncbi:MAG: thiaminase II, partial [Calditrichaeota bacterium]